MVASAAMPAQKDRDFSRDRRAPIRDPMASAPTFLANDDEHRFSRPPSCCPAARALVDRHSRHDPDRLLLHQPRNVEPARRKRRRILERRLLQIAGPVHAAWPDGRAAGRHHRRMLRARLPLLRLFRRHTQPAPNPRDRNPPLRPLRPDAGFSGGGGPACLLGNAADAPAVASRVA